MNHTTKLTQKEADRLRLMRFFNEVIDVGFGTLWWVPDFKWEENLKHFVPRKDGAHVGLIIRLKKLSSPQDPVPTLLGRSAQGPIRITGVTKGDPNRPTHFGNALRPGFFGQKNFITLKGGKSTCKFRSIPHKPTVSDSEKKDIITFLKEKGLI